MVKLEQVQTKRKISMKARIDHMPGQSKVQGSTKVEIDSTSSPVIYNTGLLKLTPEMHEHNHHFLFCYN